MSVRVDLDRLQRTLAEANVLIEASQKGGPAAELASRKAIEAVRTACRISARMETDGSWVSIWAAFRSPPQATKSRTKQEMQSCREGRQALQRAVGEDVVATVVSLSPGPSCIVAAVAEASGVTADMIRSKRQMPRLVVARHLSMLMMRSLINARLLEIGKGLGQTYNYAWAGYGVAAATRRLNADPDEGETAKIARLAMAHLADDMARLQEQAGAG